MCALNEVKGMELTMKTINYSKSHGSFTIKYLNDNEIYEGTVNVDDHSIKTELAKYIIDNEENTTFSYRTHIGNNENVEDILLIKKNIEIVFDEVSEDIYFQFNYNENDEFKNIKYEKYLNPENIYFQFYYKSAEYKVFGTISNKVINGLKKYPITDYHSPDGCVDDFNFFKNILIYKFLKKYNLVNYNIITCVPSHIEGTYNNNPIAMMINNITKNSSYIDGSQLLIRFQTIPAQKTQGKRFEETHLNSIKINGDVRGKKIILIDDITTSGSSLKACKKILLDAGADSVICFAFSKSS